MKRERNFAEEVEEILHIVSKWIICDSCKHVSDDDEMSTVGHPCPVCKVPSKEGMSYTHFASYTVVDLIKEAITQEHKIEFPGTALELRDNTHDVSVLLLFCTLREILMNDFIRYLYFTHATSVAIYDRLIKDNRFYSQKQNALFPSLTGVKWKTALQELNVSSEFDYIELNEQLISLAEKRNKFTHEGDRWRIDGGVALDCLYSIEPLIQLYVDLHNRFVHARWKEMTIKDKKAQEVVLQVSHFPDLDDST